MSAVQTASDASPLIALAQIARLSLLRELFGQIIVPVAVRREVAPTLPDLPGWITERTLPGPLDPAVGRASLDAGESEALTLAVEIGAARVVIDDRRARRVAEDLGFNTIGTGGVLLLAKRRGLLAAIQPELDSLAAVGFYLSSRAVGQSTASRRR